MNGAGDKGIGTETHTKINKQINKKEKMQIKLYPFPSAETKASSFPHDPARGSQCMTAWSGNGAAGPGERMSSPQIASPSPERSE